MHSYKDLHTYTLGSLWHKSFSPYSERWVGSKSNIKKKYKNLVHSFIDAQITKIKHDIF